MTDSEECNEEFKRLDEFLGNSQFIKVFYKFDEDRFTLIAQTEDGLTFYKEQT